MSMTVDELIRIQDLPEFLRSEHFFNDIQHAMLVILFRHALTALRAGQTKLSDTVIDNLSLYFYIHFLNEEEGMAYKVTQGLLERDALAAHSELHIKFLDYWRDNILEPHRTRKNCVNKTLEELADFYNLIIKHIDGTDLKTYGSGVIAETQTRTELARISAANMPMSPFMPGAYQTMRILDWKVAGMVDRKRISPKALDSIGRLNLIPHVGRVLPGAVGSFRDRFVMATRGDQDGDAHAAFNLRSHMHLPDMDKYGMSSAQFIAA